MDLRAEHELTCRPDQLRPLVTDLTRYPEWLTIVPRVEIADAAPDDPGAAWWVTLRGRLGPVSRAKRLRMVRAAEQEGEVRFERREVDGRRHSRWELDVRWAETRPDRTRLVMDLHYGGGLFEPLVQRLLDTEIERSRDRLDALVAAS